MQKISWRRVVCASLLSVGALSNTACFGSFPLTRKVYAFNKNVSPDKWVRELVFLAIGPLVPVYGVAGLIDVVILNSIEFWTGKEQQIGALPASQTKTITRGDVTITQTMTMSPTERRIVLEEAVAGTFRSRTTLRQATGASVVTAHTVFADGRTETRTLTVDEAGAMTIASSTGTRRTLTAAQVEAAAARLSLPAAATTAF